MRSQLAVYQESLVDMRAQRDGLHRDLQMANTRHDRQNSRTVQAANPRTASAAPEVPNGDAETGTASAAATPVRAVSGCRFVA